MADQKLTALSEISVPTLEDLAYLVDDPSGTPASVKASLTRLLGLIPVCQGRLTLTSGVPVTTTDVTGASTIYFTPYNGNLVRIYDGTRWRMYSFTELSLALGTLVNAQAYDVFIFDDSGTLTLETAEWASATVTMTIATPCVVTWTGHGLATGNSVTFTNSGGALPTGVAANTQYWITRLDNDTFKLSTSTYNVGAGTFVNTSGSQSGTHTGHQPQARATALALQDGVYCKNGALTRLYLGTFMTTSTTTTEDSYGGASQAGGKRFLWNNYNRVRRHIGVIDTTDSWTYATAAWRAVNVAAGNRVECVCGLAQDVVAANVFGRADVGGTHTATNGVGVDSTTVNSAALFAEPVVTSAITAVVPVLAAYRAIPSVGYHYLQWIEYVRLGTTTIYGDGGGVSTQSGMFVEVMA